MRWRWASDRLWARDKAWHLLGGLVSPLLVWMLSWLLAWILSWLLARVLLGFSPVWCFIVSLGFWWLFEVKDALVPHERYGWFGGDGFSWWDGLASSVGVMAGWAILEIFTLYP